MFSLCFPSPRVEVLGDETGRYEGDPTRGHCPSPDVPVAPAHAEIP